MKTTRNQLIKIINEKSNYTSAHDDSPYLKGDQKKNLSDELQRAIINFNEKDKSDDVNESIQSMIQASLDVAGLFPGAGFIADGLNTVISAYSGDAIGAVLSAISMIPLVGDAIGKSGKVILFSDSLNSNITDTVSDALSDENSKMVSSFLEIIDDNADTDMKKTWETEILPKLKEKLKITVAENKQKENKMITTEQQIREHIRTAIKEITLKNSINEESGTVEESSTLSEARQHVRDVINEVMVGMTPITRMGTQNRADTVNQGNSRKVAVNKADIGMATFDLNEWASIAGITEEIGDDMGDNSMLRGDASLKDMDNVENLFNDPENNDTIDIGEDNYDVADEIPGMIEPDRQAVTSAVSGDSYDADVDADEFDFMKFLEDFVDPDVSVIGDKAGSISYEEE
jgi:hypothetical protein